MTPFNSLFCIQNWNDASPSLTFGNLGRLLPGLAVWCLPLVGPHCKRWSALAPSTRVARSMEHSSGQQVPWAEPAGGSWYCLVREGGCARLQGRPQPLLRSYRGSGSNTPDSAVCEILLSEVRLTSQSLNPELLLTSYSWPPLGHWPLSQPIQAAVSKCHRVGDF